MDSINNKIFQIAKDLGVILKQQQLKLTTAESCTGGGIAQAITMIAGSAEWFERGFVTYSNEAKQEMLGINPALIEKFGAVSEEVAKAMAEGALQFSHANISVAVTGIAGPGCGGENKPVGTVWFAWAIKNSLTQTAHQCFDGDRETVRAKAVIFALEGIINLGPLKNNLIKEH